VIVFETGLPAASTDADGVTTALNPGICIAADAGAASNSDGITTDRAYVPTFVTPSGAVQPCPMRRRMTLETPLVGITPRVSTPACACAEEIDVSDTNIAAEIAITFFTKFS
jgi:hypothetical protein